MPVIQKIMFVFVGVMIGFMCAALFIGSRRNK